MSRDAESCRIIERQPFPSTLMAYRVRLFHPMVVGILAICLLTYSFYATNSVSFLSRNEDRSSFSMTAPSSSAASALISKTANPNKTVIILSAQNTTSEVPVSISSKLHRAEAPVNGSAKKKIMVEAIQKIPPKSSSRQQAANNSTGNGIITRALYVDGFKASSTAMCADEGRDLKLLVAITSAPAHNEARKAIRLTWGHYALQRDVKILFFLGKTSDVQLSKKLDEEDEMYGDLVRAEYLDSYNNLTLKTVSILNWADRFCNSARFLLKTDDDMFINIPILLNFTEKHSQDKNTIFGRVAKKWKPIRNKKSKYYVPPQQYQPAVFPDFTTGPAYLLTGDVISSLLEAALNRTYLKLEDVFITGIVAEQIKAKRLHVNEFLNKHVTLNACTIQKSISIHMVKFHEQFDIWKKLLDGKSKCNK